MVRIEDINVIRKRVGGGGYEIVFDDGRVILMSKARTIIALLILIKYGQGSESDLTTGSVKLSEIRAILDGKYPNGLILDSYGDANKPFSELWVEEGFSWITSAAGTGTRRSRVYILAAQDHDKLFSPVTKANRKAPSTANISRIDQRLPGLCNLCGANVRTDAAIPFAAFSRDRLRQRIDHRVPVEKGGTSTLENFQILCFYCNKSKWQVCNVCPFPNCNPTCVLAFPERSKVVAPTGEDISDRIK